MIIDRRSADSSQPRISVVTISFNDVDGLMATFDSLKPVFSHDMEWIIIDGGSTDKTIAMFSVVANVDVFVSEIDSGIYDAMRKGVGFCRGEYVVFINSGDLIVNHDLFRSLSTDFALADVNYFSANIGVNGLPVDVRYARSPNRSIWHSVPGNQQATLYRTSLLKMVGVPQSYRICGDYALACKLYVNQCSSSFYREILSEFGLGGVSTHSIIKLNREAWAIQRDILGANIVLRLFSSLLRMLSMLRTYFRYRFYS